MVAVSPQMSAPFLGREIFLDPVAPGSVSGITDHDLMLCFESLGHDCEFGLLQRHFGAEPLGLLRWGGTHLVHLIDALDHDFERLGDIQYNELTPIGGEYYLTELRYGMSRHTHVTVEEGLDLGALLQYQLKLTAFFLRCFRETLAEGTKIFVFKDFDNASAHAVLELSRALRNHGEVDLLVVHAHGRLGAPAELEQVSEHAWLARIDRFGGLPDGWNISTGHWLAILRFLIQDRNKTELACGVDAVS